jgi:hypothetical protein
LKEARLLVGAKLVAWRWLKTGHVVLQLLVMMLLLVLIGVGDVVLVDLHAEFFGFAHVDGHGRSVGVLSERLKGLMFWLEEKII